MAAVAAVAAPAALAAGYDAFMQPKMTVDDIQATVPASAAAKDPDAPSEVPQLAASSSSGHSAATEKANEEATQEATESAASWKDRLSVCTLDFPCGRLDVELTKDGESLPNDTAAKEQASQEALPSKPWGERVAEKAHKWLVAWGLARKKDQTRLTDFYPAKPVLSPAAKETERLLATSPRAATKKKQEGKGQRQTLITDFGPVPAVVTVGTVETERAHGPASEGASLWGTVQGFFGRIQASKACQTFETLEASTCDAIEAVTAPACNAAGNVRLPKAEDLPIAVDCVCASADEPAEKKEEATKKEQKGKTEDVPW